MGISSLLRGWGSKKTMVEPFDSSPSNGSRPESAPAALTPRIPSGASAAKQATHATTCRSEEAFSSESGHDEKVRPSTTAEETRPLGESQAAAASKAAAAAATKVANTAMNKAVTEVDAKLPRQPDFGAPLTLVHANVEDAYGATTAAALRSSKWDKRVQALKAVGVVLKGLELGNPAQKPSCIKGLRLRDRSLCWRAACQVLHHCIRDKVIPVRLASHELFCDVFGQNTGGAIETEELLYATRSLLHPLVERLGDSNVRIHESARRCALLCSETKGSLGLRAVLAMLQEHLEGTRGRERTKVYFGVLDTVNFLCRHFPSADSSGDPSLSSYWAMDDIVFFVRSGMDDTLGPRVRGVAVQLAVTLRLTFGSAVVGPLLQGLRPAVKTLLEEHFAEVADGDDEMMDGEDCERDGPDLPGCVNSDFCGSGGMDGLVICGSAIKVAAARSAGPPPVENEDEDLLMDDILEETGHVFKTTATVGKPLNHEVSTSVLDTLEARCLLGDGDDVDSDTGDAFQSVRDGHAIEVF